MRTSRRIGLARVISKRGWCSRSAAEKMIREGRVAVRGRIILDPETPTLESETQIRLDDLSPQAPRRRYLMLNKPRGLVTTAKDEHARDTVYQCFDGAELGWIAPVGRLDKASEGLLLFSNDPAWAASITSPDSGPTKTYHVQVVGIPNPAVLDRMKEGVDGEGERLSVSQARLLRSGERNAWLEIELDEGRNRQIRRILSALDIEVLRLVRVAIGPLALGDLAKGAWRDLTEAETAALRGE
ncbi:pseudouridine synthase [Solilutibacter tolerans]|uniref:Pseudouridine synthase n=1 Tax=Solilutibacter tolerans TaxID=1604334 RepID=A0A1N6TET3_9GAMM|nr:pseudouridine synthase [Lysobacter tolerans]SIQ51898.1 23S rRNA pseudouridine2605 synthase [Lysobacter tolerans]